MVSSPYGLPRVADGRTELWWRHKPLMLLTSRGPCSGCVVSVLSLDLKCFGRWGPLFKFSTGLYIKP